ncbi:MAG TPA: class I adenylate-forming enzyme family protein [Accumulibacter sp.]|uniref:class I adenylate-forming enzyme family protein n=1 Tax=Accumulibacter sp. TaxID=2053492 RepID=UPI002C09155A|nr:class I adenylate-forming enzyme family protein [Accumulibacter sp.]HRD87844.1 class I adenylate-forming enzyme family protein [Accumulibacter sp.]
MFLDLRVGNLAEPVSGRAWSRSEIARQVARRVARFKRSGLSRGDRVFLPFGNSLEFFAELLAIWKLGACAVPIDSRLTAFEIRTLVSAALPRLAVVDHLTEAAVVEALADAGLPVVETTQTGDEEATAGFSQLDDDALILFTSGSTGAPKGVVHTHRSLRARWMGLRDHLGVAPFARTLCLLPTHFGHGLICNCLFPWLSGMDLFVTPPFRPEIIIRLGQMIDDNRITFLSSVPAVWKLATRLSKPPQSGTLQRVHCGSAPLSAHAWEEIRAWTGTRQVCNSYGITETGSWVAGLGNADCAAEDGLIGSGWGAIIKVLHTADTTQPLVPEDECLPGESGFVWLNTPALMKGYFQRDDLTALAVRDGWFLTGDIGFLDDHGRLVLRGRERDEINRGGMKIYPSDVDTVVERFEGASDVCTFALDDEVYGQAVGMAVVLTNSENATIKALHSWMRSQLAEHKMPMRWWLVDEIPRTSRGKINRDAVKAACAGLRPLDLAHVLAGEMSG